MSFREGIDNQGTYYQINEVVGTTPILFIHGVGPVSYTHLTLPTKA